MVSGTSGANHCVWFTGGGQLGSVGAPAVEGFLSPLATTGPVAARLARAVSGWSRAHAGLPGGDAVIGRSDPRSDAVQRRLRVRQLAGGGARAEIGLASCPDGSANHRGGRCVGRLHRRPAMQSNRR